MRLFLPALLVVLFFSAVLGQADATSFVHTYGGLSTDFAHDCCITADNGMALLVYQTAVGAGGPDFMLMKTDSVGVEQWTKTYGGTGIEVGRSVIEHSLDNGLLMAGWAQSSGAVSADYMLVKTNSVGVELWSKTYGGPDNEYAYCVMEHSIDQGFLIVGKTVYSPSTGGRLMMIVKTNSVGVAQWSKVRVCCMYLSRCTCLYA
jgi:hypothetical protein